MNRIKPLPRLRLTLLQSLLAAVLLAGCITLLSLWMAPAPITYVLGCFLRQPILIVLNALPVGLLLLFFAFLTGNVFFGAAVTNLVVGVLSVANRIKIQVRDEPVFPRDLGLFREAAQAAGNYHISYPVPMIVVLLLSTAALAGLGLLIGRKPVNHPLGGWKGRLLGAAGSLAALVVLIVFVLGSAALYNALSTTNPYRLSVVFNETGFPYNFCRHFTTYLVDKPAGFSRSEAEEWETGDQSGLGKPIHLVMVMNEAFSDITDHPSFTYAPEEDPLKNLHVLREDPHAVSGHLIVPGFAGGTANTEFDVLTGMQTNGISSGNTSAMRVVNRNLDSVLRVFRNDGYHTAFLHPGDDWFYNRENVYRWLGTEETTFIDQMEDPEYKGRWVTDDYTAKLIEEQFQAAMDAGELFCGYATTIQNHMSYTLDKYGDGYDFPPVQNSAALSDEVRTTLSVYAEGIRDADAMLGRLADYFAGLDQPVVLVFFGDHLPHLGDGGYRELGLDTEDTSSLWTFATPYIIWANDAAAEALDWDRAVEALDLPENGQLSASFLGAALLELTGRGEESAWFAYLNQLRRQLPVVQNQTCMLMDGTLVRELTEEQAALIQKWRRWSYYKLEYKDVAG